MSDLVGPGGDARKTKPEDVVYGSGADRLKVVWLPTVSFGDSTLGGPLAVVRPSERFAEAYGVGGYRGQHDRVRFSVPRVGGGYVVAAEEDGCKGRKGNEACRAVTAIYLPYLGSLKRVAEITTERYANIPANERGASGLLEYHLQASIQYNTTGIALTEVVEVHDDKGRALRRVEGERALTLVDGGFSGSDPLWDKIVTH